MTPSMTDPAVRLHAAVVSAWVSGCHRVGTRRARSRLDDRGEGVVSAAIVVLIMAGIGALMWVGFQSMWTDIEDKTNDKISEVGT